MVRFMLALSACALATSPALAANYSATPANPIKESRIVVRDTLWSCSSEGCVGSTRNARPLVLCQSLAKKAGRIEGFVVDGRPFSATELERCNALAAPANRSSLAQAR